MQPDADVEHDADAQLDADEHADPEREPDTDPKFDADSEFDADTEFDDYPDLDNDEQCIGDSKPDFECYTIAKCDDHSDVDSHQQPDIDAEFVSNALNDVLCKHLRDVFRDDKPISNADSLAAVHRKPVAKPDALRDTEWLADTSGDVFDDADGKQCRHHERYNHALEHELCFSGGN